jgi:hypothetical protein
MRRNLLTAVACLVGCWAQAGWAQQPPIHYFHSATLPPGTVGQGQLQRFPALQGYAQPVKVLVPDGARVSFWADGQFEPPQPRSTMAGLQVGSVYRLQVTSIPFYEGFEVYPTVEVINRLYPPPGQEWQFPVPIELTQAELELALSGHFITRVIYLEDPAMALAVADRPDQQRYFEAHPGEDPLRLADQLGRPMAILRMGSRLPDAETGELADGAASPPLERYEPSATPTAPVPRTVIERQSRNIPRIRLER